ncbi:MAG: TetR/AcrR family transcriptional regulator [Candidatus Izemoplasmatales bacterium]
MQKNLDIKEKITKEAKRLLKTQGAFTIKEIADACFINIAAVNYHFGSKENLLNLVLQEIIDELKSLLTHAIDDLPEDSNNENAIEFILNLTYSFAIENIGIINYLFLQNEYQGENSHILIKEFFSDSPFTRDIYKKIAESTNTQDFETLRVKYLVLFSSFAIPLFIQILGTKNKTDILSLKTPSFRKKYIHELIKILY